MNKRKYNDEEIRLLNTNQNIVIVKYGRQIEYKDSFKKWAVIQSIKHPEMSANEIFEMAGFNINIIGERVADSRIRYWKNQYNRSRIKENKDEHEKYDNNSIYKMLVLLYNRMNSMLDIIGKNVR